MGVGPEGATGRNEREEVRALLTLTDSAVEAVKEIVSSLGTLETGGQRLAAEWNSERQTRLQLSVVPLSAEDDEVIEEEGARVFLD